MKQHFKFSLQRFAGNIITGHIVRPASGSVLSGNSLSFRTRSSSDTPTPSAKAFNDYTWEEISAVAQSGKGADYFNIGDCKEITLNGSIGDYLTLNNEKLYVYILHFNYPMNGTADNNIILGGFKTALTDGTDVALCDSKYNTSSTDGTICFNINHWGNNNYGGWKGSDFRYDILGATNTQPSDYGKAHTTSCVGYDATAATLINPKANTLLAALPTDMRNVLRLWSRWVDAKGNSSNVEANIEETVDAVTLLAACEIYSMSFYNNSYEKNHQTKMDYYNNGNSTVQYNHSSTSSAVYSWLCSARSDASDFCCSHTLNNMSWANDVYFSFGVAPAFKV